MSTDILKSVRAVLVADDTIDGYCGDRIVRARVSETGSIIFPLDAAPYPIITIMSNEEDTELGIPAENVTLDITAWEDANNTIPQEKVELMILRVLQLFDRNPSQISNAGFSVVCHYLIKKYATEVLYDVAHKAYFKKVIFDCKVKVSYLNCNS